MPRNGNGVAQTRIERLLQVCIRIRIAYHLIIKSIEQRETGVLVCLKGIHQVMAGNVEPAAAIFRCHVIIQAMLVIHPAALCRAIVKGVLDGKDRLRTVVIFGDEIFPVIVEQVVLTGINHIIGFRYNLVQSFLVNINHIMLFILFIRLIEPGSGQVCCRGNGTGSAYILLYVGQILLSKLEISGDFI